MMVTKPKYEKNVGTSNPWEPQPVFIQTIRNRTSPSHDILNHLPNPNSTSSYVESNRHVKNTVNFRKGVAEFSDVQRPTAVNINVDHVAALKENPNVFKRKDGIFTHLYDAAARFGEAKVFKA